MMSLSQTGAREKNHKPKVRTAKMQQRGRKGIARIEGPSSVTVIERPEAPLDLTPDQTEEWQALVDAMPADWFPRETWPLLAQYCRHTVTSRRLGQLIDAEMARSDMDMRTLRDLLTLQRGETASLKQLASSMRLAQQSTWNAKSGDTAKAKRTVKRLWED